MKRAVVCVVMLISKAVFCQSTAIDLEKLMDEIFPVQDENFNYEELYETYAQWLAHPIHLNTASPEQIQSLLILNNQQLNDLLQYRAEQGPLLSLYELQVIPSFTENTIRLLSPFVQLDDLENKNWKGLLNRIANEDNNYLVTRLEKALEMRAGFKDESPTSIQYKGPDIKIYNRFKTSASGDFSIGLTTEQDAGERFLFNPNDKQFGFDFFSAHAQVINKGKINNLILGDFQAQFGQGLTLGGGFGMGKGSEVITTMRRANLGFIPYTSAVEQGFFRGSAISIALNRLVTLHGFASGLHRDGTIQINEETQETTSSLFFSGLHRTTNEINSRKSILEKNLGGSVQFKFNQLDAGLIIHHTNFSTSLNRNPNPYNQFLFRGTNNSNIGGYLNYSRKNYTLFSELSHSWHRGSGFIGGILIGFNQNLEGAFHLRYLASDFYSFYSNAITENTNPQNEQGFYWGLKYRLSKTETLQGYIDLFKFPWLRFQSYKPSAGHEWMLRYSATPNKTTLFFIQIRQERKERNSSGDNPNYTTAFGTKSNIWINVDYAANSTVSFKTRLQWTGYNLNSNQADGFALLQDVNINWNKFSISGRAALFDTDSYDTRIYLYERDAWLAFSIPALQGVGLRRYILIQYKANKKLDFWLRWANTTYENRNSIGSQGEEIIGNARNDFKMQARIKF